VQQYSTKENAMTLLDFKDLSAKKGIKDSDTTIWRKIKAGQFPKPLKMGRRNCWVEEEIDQHIQSKLVERDAMEASHA
jgi:predicted DNA-binding transcriptional regulator AlpA